MDYKRIPALALLGAAVIGLLGGQPAPQERTPAFS